MPLKRLKIPWIIIVEVRLIKRQLGNGMSEWNRATRKLGRYIPGGGIVSANDWFTNNHPVYLLANVIYALLSRCDMKLQLCHYKLHNSVPVQCFTKKTTPVIPRFDTPLSTGFSNCLDFRGYSWNFVRTFAWTINSETIILLRRLCRIIIYQYYYINRFALLYAHVEDQFTEISRYAMYIEIIKWTY